MRVDYVNEKLDFNAGTALAFGSTGVLYAAARPLTNNGVDLYEIKLLNEPNNINTNRLKSALFPNNELLT